MYTLRPYQREAIDLTYEYMRLNAGHPVVVLPTGSGKSIVIAALCEEAMRSWPATKILMLASRKELIEQNAEKMLTIWPNAPLGIFSASIGKREIDAITFAGIQSVRNRALEIGHRDLVIVDECDEISHEETGAYRTLIAELTAINPALRVVGFTATPYRMGHGLITDKPAIFDQLIEPTSVRELIEQGYLARLTSKSPRFHQSVEGVHKRGGEFIESELQKAVDNERDTRAAVQEIIERAGDRKHWLVFCSGVDHARHVRDELIERGVNAACVTGDTPAKEREAILSAFKSGEIEAVTNANILTVGFDAPDTDLVALLRPTMSARLYVQMVGRGLRLKSDGGDCLVLDFAGNVDRHGPIVSVRPPNRKGEGGGVAPSKICPECDEIVGMSARVCPACGYNFPAKPKEYALGDADIMGEDRVKTVKICRWKWTVETSRKSGKEMIVCRYYPDEIGAQPLTEYFCVYHDGFAGQKGVKMLREVCLSAGLFDIPGRTEDLEACPAPEEVKYMMDGKFPRILSKKWPENAKKIYEDLVPF